jgi:hypothetical protein
MGDLTDRIRARQMGVSSWTDEQIREAIERPFREHGEHPWHQVSRCVYCGPCGVRLYQGTMPTDHVVYVPPRKPRKMSAGDRMMQLREERYGR